MGGIEFAFLSGQNHSIVYSTPPRTPSRPCSQLIRTCLYQQVYMTRVPEITLYVGATRDKYPLRPRQIVNESGCDKTNNIPQCQSTALKFMTNVRAFRHSCVISPETCGNSQARPTIDALLMRSVSPNHCLASLYSYTTGEMVRVTLIEYLENKLSGIL